MWRSIGELTKDWVQRRPENDPDFGDDDDDYDVDYDQASRDEDYDDCEGDD